jgi:carbon storage regulator
MIGDEIEITVVDIRGDKVRLGITAPTRIAVHRKEVYEAIRRENQQAAEQAATLGRVELDTLGNAISPGPARLRTAASRLTAAPPPTVVTPPGSPGVARRIGGVGRAP